MKNKTLNGTRLKNLTDNIKEAWRSIGSTIVNFSLILYEAFESKIYLEKFKSWEEYVKSELPIKRRQADYYRKVGEFYCKYKTIIKSESFDTFTQKDFLGLIKKINTYPTEKEKKLLIKKIFSSTSPQIELEKFSKNFE